MIREEQNPTDADACNPRKEENISDFEIENGVLVKYLGADGDVVMPEGVSSIGEHAFCMIGSMGSIILPDDIPSVDEHAFSYYCLRTEGVLLPGRFNRQLTSI